MDERYNRNLLYNRNVMQRVHKVPKHVLNWADENYDGLWDAYNQFKRDFAVWPEIMDRGDFPSFCACIARLSSVDSPRTENGLAGGRDLPQDYMNNRRNKAADSALQRQALYAADRELQRETVEDLYREGRHLSGI